MASSHAALLVVLLSVSLTLITGEEHSNDARAKKAAFPAAAVSSISGIVPAGIPRAPGYYPGHAAYPYNAGIYTPHAQQYVPGHPLTAGYPYAPQGYPYAAHPYTAGYSNAGYAHTGYPHAGYPHTGYPQAGYPHAGYPYNKFGHVSSPFGYPYKPFDDGQYYPEKYEYPYTSYPAAV